MTCSGSNYLGNLHNQLKGALVVSGAAFWHVGRVLQNCST